MLGSWGYTYNIPDTQQGRRSSLEAQEPPHIALLRAYTVFGVQAYSCSQVEQTNTITYGDPIKWWTEVEKDILGIMETTF